MNFVRVILAGVILFGLAASFSSAQTQIYVAQNAAGANSGADCSDAHSAAWFNTARNWGAGAGQIGPGGTVHLCGTITSSANSTVLTVQGSGTSGNPITILFESGAIVQAPYCSGSGCINGTGRSYIVIDGNAKTGMVQNTLNGASGAACPGGPCTQQAPSHLIELQNCNNCTVQNLIVGPTYLEVQNAASQNSTNEVAIQIYGSNDTIANNVISNCGWCVNFGQWQNGNSTFQAYENNFTNFGHAFALYGADGAVCGPPCSIIHDNTVGPAGTNWDASGCPNHKDGIHYYGGARHDGAYVYNNWIGGNWGACSTGFIFHDGSPLANIKDNYTWNNVFVVGIGTAGDNTNGWVYGSNDGGGVVVFLNNTFIGSGTSDNSVAYQFWASNAFTFEGNVTVNVGNPIQTHTNTETIIDYNLYHDLCNLGNCYSWNSSSSLASFNAWKTACACDAHSVSTPSPGINSDGSLQSGSPARDLELNLSSSATGYLTSLSYDTSDGNTRTPVGRPSSGNWDAGAYQFGVSSGVPVPPTGLAATVQ